MAQLEKPWTKTTLFQNLKEVTKEGYQQMLAYEAAGGELDIIDKSAKKYYEKYMKRHRKSSSNVTMTVDEDDNSQDWSDFKDDE